MLTLKDLFENCAYKIVYKECGNKVNYAFVEDKKTETLYIYFECSNGLVDWVRNFLFTETKYKMFKVHKGFYSAYREVRDIIRSKIEEKYVEQEGVYKNEIEYKIHYRWKNIVVVGYSHGSALVQIALEDIVYHREDIEDNIYGYAFESPRALKVKKAYRHLWKNLYVIRNGNDLITHLPPKIFGYSDLGEMIHIKGDTSIVRNKLPKFIKYHYPECVLDGLKKCEELERFGKEKK